jgi:ribosomal protein RSM22 (predicted rRNA methylase)
MPTVRSADPEAYSGSLQAAIEAGLAGRRVAHLAEGASTLTRAYRSGEAFETPALSSKKEAAVYAAYRMPATAAAVGAALRQARASLPDWNPASVIDLGAGTGGSAWAVGHELESVRTATLLEQSAEAIALGRTILAGANRDVLSRADWRRWVLPATAKEASSPLPGTDLAIAAYVLGELRPAQQAELVRLAAAAAPAVILIEPGSLAGHRRVLAARDQLMAAGFTVVAPCPHQLRCPLDVEGDWCHFAVRVQRSSLHRQVKGATLSYEDEKFSFVAAVRGMPAQLPAARVIQRSQQRKNLVSLALCVQDGSSRTELVTKRHGDAYRLARKAAWGDGWQPVSEAGDAGEGGDAAAPG